MQGITVDEGRVNAINKLADKLISQGRTDTKLILDKKNSLNTKYEIFCIPSDFVLYLQIIPNTAVFGPTNFIGTIASTARMTVRHGWQFMHWMKISTVAGRGH